MRFAVSVIFFFSAVVVFVTGCSDVAGPKVKGQVLLDGKPVAGARVTFTGKGGGGGVTDNDGKFYLDGSTFKTVQPGKYIVLVTKYVDMKTGKAIEAEDYEQLIAAGKAKNELPARYSQNEENPLTGIEIKNGMNELKPFELKSK
jgi:hypothetical protein